MQMRFTIGVVIYLVACLSTLLAVRTPVRDEEAGSFRELLESSAENPVQKAVPYSQAAIDLNKDCSTEYPKLNYKPVTNVCSSRASATKACCAAFNNFACQLRSQVNNFNSVCPKILMSYLNNAGGFQDGYFSGPCVDGKNEVRLRVAARDASAPFDHILFEDTWFVWNGLSTDLPEQADA